MKRPQSRPFFGVRDLLERFFCAQNDRIRHAGSDPGTRLCP